MSRKWLPLAIIGGIVLVVGLFFISRYNSLISQAEAVDGQWANVQNVLQRRADLIPNLVETVKGYASHEKEVFEQIANARSKLAGARDPATASAAAASCMPPYRSASSHNSARPACGFPAPAPAWRSRPRAAAP